MSIRETLTQAIASRDEEIANYQININNYEIALAQIAQEHSGGAEIDQSMQEFATHLQELLRQTRVEQRKSQIIRAATLTQLQSLPPDEQSVTTE